MEVKDDRIIMLIKSGQMKRRLQIARERKGDKEKDTYILLQRTDKRVNFLHTVKETRKLR